MEVNVKRTNVKSCKWVRYGMYTGIYGTRMYGWMLYVTGLILLM